LQSKQKLFVVRVHLIEPKTVMQKEEVSGGKERERNLGDVCSKLDEAGIAYTKSFNETVQGQKKYSKEKS
jgi:hypothetical protein